MLANIFRKLKKDRQTFKKKVRLISKGSVINKLDYQIQCRNTNLLHLGHKNPIQRGSLKNRNLKSQRCEKRLNLNSNLACYKRQVKTFINGWIRSRQTIRSSLKHFGYEMHYRSVDQSIRMSDKASSEKVQGYFVSYKKATTSITQQTMFGLKNLFY